MIPSERFGSLLLTAHAGSWSMSMGTGADAVPANLIVPEIAPVLAASIEIAPPLRDDSADSRRGFDLLHPPANTTINAKQSAGLSLRVIDDDWKPEIRNCSLRCHRSAHGGDNRLGKFRSRSRATHVA